MFSTKDLLLQHQKDNERTEYLSDKLQTYISKVREVSRLQGLEGNRHSSYCKTRCLEGDLATMKRQHEENLRDLRSQLQKESSSKATLQEKVDKLSLQTEHAESRINTEQLHRQHVESQLESARRSLNDKHSLLKEAEQLLMDHQNKEQNVMQQNKSLTSRLNRTEQRLNEVTRKCQGLEQFITEMDGRFMKERETNAEEIAHLKDEVHRESHVIDSLRFQLDDYNAMESHVLSTADRLKTSSEIEVMRFKQQAMTTHDTALQKMKKTYEENQVAMNKLKQENNILLGDLQRTQAQLNLSEVKLHQLENQHQAALQCIDAKEKNVDQIKINLERKINALEDELHEKAKELLHLTENRIPTSIKLDALSIMLEKESQKLNTLQEPVCFAQTGSSLSRFGSRSLCSSPAFGRGQRTHYSTHRLTRPQSSPHTLQSSKRGHRSPAGRVEDTRYKTTWSPEADIIDCHSTSNGGSLKIAEIDPLGRFIRIFNASSVEDLEIGGYTLLQRADDRPSASFRFPQRTIVNRCSYVTIWTPCNEAINKPPTDFLWQGEGRWRAGNECITALCNSTGKVTSFVDKTKQTETEKEDDNGARATGEIDQLISGHQNGNDDVNSRVKHHSSSVRCFKPMDQWRSPQQLSQNTVSFNLKRPMPKPPALRKDFDL